MDYATFRIAAEARALGFRVSSDDFSTRIVHPDDRMFWIRVEIVDPACPYVTDAITSGFGAAEMAIALGQVLAAAGADRPDCLIFRDIRTKGERIDSEYRPMLGLYAKQSRRFLDTLFTRERHGKLDLIATFSS